MSKGSTNILNANSEAEVPSFFVTSIQIQTHKSTDKLTSLHTNSQDTIGFDVAKCAAQLLYGPVLVFIYLYLELLRHLL